MSDNQIIAVKLLIEKAQNQIGCVGAEKAFALLHLHDALDWAMQYLYQSVERKKSEMSFKNFAKYISDHEDKFGYFDKVKSEELDQMRNLFKHSFVMPNEDRLRYLLTWCEEQINSLFNKYLGKSLADFSLAETIEIDGVSNEIELARVEHTSNNIEAAIHHIAVAFDIITRGVEESIEYSSGKKLAISADFTFANSFFMHIRELGDLIGKGHDLEKSWDNIIESVVHLNEMTLIDMLGLNIQDYYKFKRWTPTPRRTLNGQYFSDIMPRLRKELPKIDYDFCENFVIQAGVNASSLIRLKM